MTDNNKILEEMKKNIIRKQAANKIVFAYRKKTLTNKKFKNLGDYICTNLTNKNIYRPEILKQLEDLKSPNHIKNLYLYYCKLGSKVLGFDGNKYLIKKISNSIFVNTSFKSTNFTTIHFKLCKFIQGNLNNNDRVKRLFERKTELKSFRVHKPNDIMEFETTKIENCLFEECFFYNVKFKDLRVGYIITKSQSRDFGRKVEGTRFFKSNFHNCTFEYPFYTKTLNTDTIDHQYDMKFKQAKNCLGTGTININTLMIRREDVVESPLVVFQDCNFSNFRFESEKTQRMEYMNNTLFLNCSFNNNGQFFNLSFNYVKFKNCKFNSITFTRVVFNSCIFEDCVIDNCNFNSCNFASACSIMKNTKLLNKTTFNNTILSNPENPLYFLKFTSNCVLNEVWFTKCSLINLVFNRDIIDERIPELLLANSYILNMKNCHFISNKLYGTNFDYCNLEGSDFQERIDSIEEINWFGKAFAIIENQTVFNNLYKNLRAADWSSKLKTIFEGATPNNANFYKNFESSYNMEIIQIHDFKERLGLRVFKLKHSDYQRAGFSNVLEFLYQKEHSIGIMPWDYFYQKGPNLLIYFIPPTSFKKANLKGCRFQSLDGFESFDFTQVAKDSAGKHMLTSTNFTNVDLTNASFKNCNLIGTVFQLARVAGADFRDSITNEYTDFENTLDIGLTLNADHINFGELQNNANETHSRAQFIINNREKYREFYNKCRNDAELPISIHNFKQYIPKIINEGRIDDSNKIILKQNFASIIRIPLLEKKIFTPQQEAKLKTDLESIVNDEFIDILISQKNPLNQGTPGKWCWLDIVLESLIFLLNCPNSYIYSFIEFYMNEVFNAHGAGGKSCTLGMVERLVTIHSQAAERFIMTMDIEPTSSNVEIIKHYNENDPTIVDTELTEEFIKKFNDPSKIDPPNSCKKILHKFALNQFLNLLKPNSNLPEVAEDDIGIVFDYTIKPEWREEFHVTAKTKVNSGNINSLDELCKFFIEWIVDKIIIENGITREVYKEIEEQGGKKLEVLKSKELELNKYLEENEIPNLKTAIIMMTSEEVTSEELIDYFEGGKNNKTTKNMKGSLSKKSNSPRRIKSNSPRRIKSNSSRRIKSAPAKISLSKLERDILVKFVELPKETVKKISEQISNKTVVFWPENMSIIDEGYRTILKERIKKIKENNAATLSHIKLKKPVKTINKTLKKETLKRYISSSNSITKKSLPVSEVSLKKKI